MRELCAMKYEQWVTNPIRFLAMTGYSIEQFSQLLPFFVQAHDAYFQQFHLDGSPRSGLRQFVLYKNAALPSHAERLVFVLSYLKLNPLQEDHADRFGLQQKQANEFIHGLKPVLEKALKMANVMPAQTDQELQLGLTQQALAGPVMLIHDATERAVPRPVDKDAQKAAYSGKKKRHTAKNAFIINTLSIILFLGTPVFGSVHDKKLADTQYHLEGVDELWQDTGYQGYHPEGVRLYQPIKKPRGGALSDAQKTYNQAVSRVRVQVEHVIGSCKRYRIVGDVCRLRKAGFVDTVLHVCAGLHTFRVTKKPVQYPNYPKPKLT